MAAPVEMEVPDPDLGKGAVAGTVVDVLAPEPVETAATVEMPAGMEETVVMEVCSAGVAVMAVMRPEETLKAATAGLPSEPVMVEMEATVAVTVQVDVAEILRSMAMGEPAEVVALQGVEATADAGVSGVGTVATEAAGALKVVMVVGGAMQVLMATVEKVEARRARVLLEVTAAMEEPRTVTEETAATRVVLEEEVEEVGTRLQVRVAPAAIVDQELPVVRGEQTASRERKAAEVVTVALVEREVAVEMVERELVRRMAGRAERVEKAGPEPPREEEEDEAEMEATASSAAVVMEVMEGMVAM
jgi:hypothetical protein